MSQIPEKSFYKVNEVCQYTDTQPYVLRFWESEFPQLTPHKNKVGQRVYTRRDLELILRIKRLLHDEEYTIAGARARLDEEDGARTPLAFLPDGDVVRAEPRATLFEPEPPKAKAAPEPARKGKTAPVPPVMETKRPLVVPQVVSALETPFIPEPPVTDPVHLRQEVRAERERAEALHAKLEQTRGDRDAAVREHAEAQRALEHQRETIADLQRDLEASRARAVKLDAAESTVAELQVKSAEANRMHREVQRLEEALADGKSALETERQTLVHERAAADALRVRLHAVEATAAEVRSRLDAAEAEALHWRERAQRASLRVAEVAATLRESAASIRR